MAILKANFQLTVMDAPDAWHEAGVLGRVPWLVYCQYEAARIDRQKGRVARVGWNKDRTCCAVFVNAVAEDSGQSAGEVV